jgi:hypothetical protein
MASQPVSQPVSAEAPVQAVVLRERANTLLREALDAADADLWGNTIRHAMVDAALALYTEAAQLEGPPLEPHDVTSWAAFLPMNPSWLFTQNSTPPSACPHTQIVLGNDETPTLQLPIVR